MHRDENAARTLTIINSSLRGLTQSSKTPPRRRSRSACRRIAFSANTSSGGRRSRAFELFDDVEVAVHGVHPREARKTVTCSTMSKIASVGRSNVPSPDKKYEGMRVSDAAKLAKRDAFDFVFDLIAENGNVGCVYFIIDEDDLTLAMRQPWVSIGSDGSALATSGPLRSGVPHPRNFGTFPRVLGKYVREEHIISLEEAVHKMSGLTADQLHLKDRGLIRERFAADLVIFDPQTVADRATFTDPFQYPMGIDTAVQELVQTNERFIERLARDQDDLKRRVLQLEAVFNQVLATSMREAILQLQREHLQSHGSLADIRPIGGYESSLGQS